MKQLLASTILLLAIFGLGGCGSGGDSGVLPVTEPPPAPPVILDPGNPNVPAVTVGGILLSVSSSAIAPSGTATLSVTLFDSSGQLISGTRYLSFTLDQPILGSITSPVLVSNGYANAIFTARSTQGTVNITATVEDVSEETSIQISTQVSAATINVLSSPTSTSVGGTTTVKATVLDSIGDPMPNGTAVNFTVDNTAIGTIIPSATTTNGEALVTFSAGITTPGTVTVTATSGIATGETTIDVTGTSAGSIEFLSADPQIISIQGSGGQETSQIQFLIKDNNGNPIVQSQNVQLVLSGPNGGEYLNSVGTTTTNVGTSVEGIASVYLHSGNIPGTATITASVVNTTLTTSSGVIAIGGGTPSSGHFSLSATTKNLEGGAVDNVQDEILTLLADRYGNKNVLKGTAVSYYSECGAIDRAVALDELGQGLVVFRTQSPAPQDVDPDPLPTAWGSGSCGLLCDQENAVISAFDTYFGIDITIDQEGNNPRDGLCSIIAVVDGEEEFTDADANGVYDLGENFVDTYDDIHIEMDDDPNNVTVIAPGKPHDPTFEDLVVDRNKDGLFNGLNGLWDYNKRIAKQYNLLITGEPGLTVSTTNINIPNGGSKTVYFAIHDLNYNRPIGGTAVAVELIGTGVTLTGTTEYEYIDSSSLGTPILAVTISDSDPATNQPEAIELKFSWDWKNASWIYSFGGIAN
jgi:hypothetical protein